MQLQDGMQNLVLKLVTVQARAVKKYFITHYTSFDINVICKQHFMSSLADNFRLINVTNKESAFAACCDNVCCWD